MTARVRNAVADVESRKKLFRATAGLSLQQQMQVASQMQTKGDDMLKKIQQMKKASRHQKQATRENNVKYEWLHEHQHLKKLEEAYSKELESLVLRMYNDACSDSVSPSSISSVAKKKSPSRPEADSPICKPTDPPSLGSKQYAKELEEIVQLEQDYRVALLKQIASDREQRQAMKQLIDGLRHRIESGTHGSPAAVTENLKKEAQELIFDTVIGHQMVDATLEDEFRLAESEFQPIFQSLLEHLKSGDGNVRSRGNQNESVESLDAMISSVCGSDVDEMLRIEIRDEFERLEGDLVEDLAAYEREFHLLASQEDAAGSILSAASKSGGWSLEDDEKFIAVLKNYERRAAVQKHPDLFYDQVKAVVPHQSIAEIKKHAKFNSHLRFYQAKCRDRQSEHNRRYAELCAKAKEKIAVAKQEQDDKARKMEQLRILQQQCSHLHEKVAEWRTTKEAEQRIKGQQDELERLLRMQQKEEEAAKEKKRRDEQKEQLEEFKKTKLVGRMVDEMLAQQQRERDEEDKALRNVFNAERVQFRQAKFERKLVEDRLEQQRREQREVERLAKLDAIKQETPYAEKISSIAADPERTRQETAAFKANVEAAEDGLPLHEKGLFPTHGYDCETLFKNARFKLGIALRNAGLHQTDYARKALANIKVSNVGAYRHAVAPPTQLW